MRKLTLNIHYFQLLPSFFHSDIDTLNIITYSSIWSCLGQLVTVLEELIKKHTCWKYYACMLFIYKCTYMLCKFPGFELKNI